mgnify:CR=1 FL=1
MAFEVFKMGKLSDHLESEAYEWVAYQITETYGLELTKNEYGYEQDVVEQVINPTEDFEVTRFDHESYLIVNKDPNVPQTEFKSSVNLDLKPIDLITVKEKLEDNIVEGEIVSAFKIPSNYPTFKAKKLK